MKKVYNIVSKLEILLLIMALFTPLGSLQADILWGAILINGIATFITGLKSALD